MIKLLYFGLFRLGLGTSALRARGRFTPLFLLDLGCYTLSQHYTHRYYYLENSYLPSRTQPTCSTCFSRWLICRQLLPARRNVFFAFGSRHTYFSRASVCQYYMIIVYNIVTELSVSPVILNTVTDVDRQACDMVVTALAAPHGTTVLRYCTTST